MVHHKTYFKLSTYILAGLFLSTFVAAATWYVDPVNGSDFYDGACPFHIPETSIGPTQTLDAIMYQVGLYDIVVLADGLYSGDLNTGQQVMNWIDSQKLYVTSANGPDTCTMVLYEPIHFDYAATGSIETCFSGITFSGPDQLETYSILILNGNSVRFEDCVFSNFNKYPDRSVILTAYTDSHAVIDGCQFTWNQALTLVKCLDQAGITVEDSTFTDNANSYRYTSTPPGGIILGEQSDNITVRNCTFTDNSSDGFYAALSITDTLFVTIEDCVIDDIMTSEEGLSCYGIYLSNVSEATVSQSRIENITGYESAGIYANETENLTLSNCQLNNNTVGLLYYDYSYNMYSRYLDITHCDFIENTSPDIGNPTYAGIILDIYNNNNPLDISLRNCNLLQNNIGMRMQGELGENCHFEIQNCLIADNRFTGIGIPAKHNSTTPNIIRNCTVANNFQYGLVTGNTIIENTIIRQETGTPLLEYNGLLTVNYCNIERGWGGAGVSNIDIDPLFVDPGIWNSDPMLMVAGTDYHLKSTAGRFDPVTQSWLQDDADSPASIRAIRLTLQATNRSAAADALIWASTAEPNRPANPDSAKAASAEPDA